MLPLKWGDALSMILPGAVSLVGLREYIPGLDGWMSRIGAEGQVFKSHGRYCGGCATSRPPICGGSAVLTEGESAVRGAPAWVIDAPAPKAAMPTPQDDLELGPASKARWRSREASVERLGVWA